MELCFEEERNFVVIRQTGRLDRGAILAAFDAAVTHERYRSGMGRLWDYREADLSGFGTDAIRDMAQHSLRYPPGINDVRVAFVTGRDLEYGLSRMFEMSSRAKTPIKVFRSMTEAEAWMQE